MKKRIRIALLICFVLFVGTQFVSAEENQGLTVYNNSGMNPIDYWIANSYELKTFLDTYEESGLKWLPNSISSRFITDLRNLYHSGNASEKAMVLTVLSAAKLYFGEETNGEVCPEN